MTEESMTKSGSSNQLFNEDSKQFVSSSMSRVDAILKEEEWVSPNWQRHLLMKETGGLNAAKRARTEDGEAVPTSMDGEAVDIDEAPEESFCISHENLYAASKRIEKHVVRSECRHSRSLSKHTGMRIWAKKDYLQITGSFKERGAVNALLQLNPEQRRRGVVAASAGNHALALAYHGQQLKIPVTVVMPWSAPLTKVANCRELQANVIQQGNDFDEATAYARQLGREKNYTYVHGFDSPAIIAGQGSIGLEILDQCPDVDAIVCPVGGGGLIAGISMAVKNQRPDVEIIGVEPLGYPSMLRALQSGEAVTIGANMPTIADGLAVRQITPAGFPILQRNVDRAMTVAEHWIALAVLRLVEMEKAGEGQAVVEGAGACALGAILSGRLDHLKGKNVVILLCGGNIDSSMLSRVMDHGLATDCRMVRFNAFVSDRPGGLHKITSCMKQVGVSVTEIIHERQFSGSDFFKVKVQVVVETRNREHAQELARALEEGGFAPQFYSIDGDPLPPNTFF